MDEASCISKLDLKRVNRSHILRLIRDNGPLSRADIARMVRVTKSAVTILTGEMLEQGILWERGEAVSRGGKLPRGRKKVLLDIDGSWRLAAGLVIGDGHLRIGVCSLTGGLVEQRSLPIPAGCSAEQLLSMARELYDDMAYKNNLKVGTAVGLGVCVAESCFPLLGITRDERGQADYTALQRAFGEFCSLPLAFGPVAVGVGAAETDYFPTPGQPAASLAVLCCGREPACALMVGGEPYPGLAAQPGALSVLSERYPSSPLGKACAAVSAAGIQSLCDRLYAGGECPSLMLAAENDPARFKEKFCEAGLDAADKAVQEALLSLQQSYQLILTHLACFYAADRILCTGENLAASAAEKAAGKLNSEFQPVQGGLVRLGHIFGGNFYLAGAALATREFFINKGGL